MKELPVEEKAKRYDDSMNRAKKELGTCGSQDCDAVRQIFRLFPELKEGDDERIKEALIEYFRWNVQQILSDFDNKEVLAWLEKQGKQKPIIPKFRVGDIITNGLCTIQISSMDDKYYWHDNNTVGGDIESIDKEYKLVEQKSAWSEEDEQMIESIIQLLYDTKSENCWNCIFIKIKDKRKEITFTSIEKWLKSLKNRIQPKQEWSKFDDQMLEAVLYDGENALGERHKEWIKSLKDRVQPKQEWSEEDYNEIETIACHLDNTDNEGMAEILRNIRDKYYHISTWKPSDEQMKVLANALSLAKNCGEESAFELRTLYEQLKKLREE